MRSDTSVALTGTTGNLGRAVLARLGTTDARLRLVVRDAARAPSGAEVAEAAYGDRAAAVRALKGTDVLFMVSAAESPDRPAVHRTFIDAAAEAGVRHVVYTSFLGAAPDATFTLARDHWATEEHLRASGMDFTFLRDSFYLDFLPGLVGDDGVIRGPAGTGRVGAVARADVARAAAAVLLAPDEHVGRVHDLTGPRALDLATVAATIAAATGRPVRYEEETLDQAYARRRGAGAPRWQQDAWVSTYTAIAAGELDVVTGTVRRLTGTEPLDLRDVLGQP